MPTDECNAIEGDYNADEIWKSNFFTYSSFGACHVVPIYRIYGKSFIKYLTAISSSSTETRISHFLKDVNAVPRFIFRNHKYDKVVLR